MDPATRLKAMTRAMTSIAFFHPNDFTCVTFSSWASGYLLQRTKLIMSMGIQKKIQVMARVYHPNASARAT